MATPLSKYSGQVRDLTQAFFNYFFQFRPWPGTKQSSRLSARGEVNDVGLWKKLRVVRLTAQVGIHQTRTFRVRAVAIRPLDGDKNGVNLPQNLWVIASEHPSALGFIVGIKNA
jgi:hypothetical protein